MEKLRFKQLLYAVAYHCNLTCDTCVALSPFSGIEFSDFKSFKNDLDRISKVVAADKFEFIGGEPLLNPQLVEYMEHAKASGISSTISISTNGLLLHKMPVCFYQLIDNILISEYPSTKFNYRKLESFLETKSKEHNFTFKFLKYKSFLQVYRDTPCEDHNINQKVFDTCDITHGSKCYFIADGKFYKCSPSLIIPKFNKSFKGADFINLESNTLLQDLKAFLDSKAYLDSCKWCKGTFYDNVQVPHKMLGTKEIKFYKDKLFNV